MPKESKDFLLRAVFLMLRAYQDVLRVPSQQSVLSHPGWITSLELFTLKGLEALGGGVQSSSCIPPLIP